MQKPLINEVIERDRHSIFMILFSALSIEGVCCVIWLLSIPSNPGGLIFGLSLNRLLLISAPLVSTIFFLVLFIMALFKGKAFQKKLENFIDQKIARFLFIFAVILSIISWCVLFFFNLLNYGKFQFISERSLPLVVWWFLTGLTILVFFQHSLKSIFHISRAFDLRLFLLISIIILVLFSLPLATGIGLHTRDVTVNDLGIPLLEWQVVFTVGLLLIFTYAKTIIKGTNLFDKDKIEEIQKYLPLIFFIAFWFSAFIFWQNQPLPINNYFAPRVLPPSFETFPFSDAERYSLDSIRIINGITSNIIISKPFHAIYLAILNYFGNLSYQKVILGQTLILAFFPSILFLIGKEIRGNTLGLGLGIFAIFREINAIQASNIANVANSKLLLSDFPSTLILSVIILLMLKWIEDPYEKHYPIILGGILGILILYRAQYLIFIPVFIGIAFLLYWKNLKKIILFNGIFILCLSVITLPLLFRNHSISGFFWFDSSDYLSVFTENYVMADPENSDTGLKSQNASLWQDQSNLSRSLIQSNYLFDISDNFFRNLISTFLIFPIRIDGSQELQKLSVINENFWAEAFHYSSPLNLLIALLNLALLITGLYLFISEDWKIGFSCMLIYLTQNLSSALFRFSGWRFIMPVDWMVLFIYIIGILGLFESLHLIPHMDQKKQISTDKSTNINLKTELKTILPFLITFLLIGSILPIRELFPAHNQSMSKSEICSYLEKNISKDKYPLENEKAIQLCDEKNSTALEGEMIYPRFFERGQGFYENQADIFYGKQNFPRLMFRFSADDILKFYLPLNQINENIRIPNGSSAIILADSDQLPKIQLILLKESNDILFSSDEMLTN